MIAPRFLLVIALSVPALLCSSAARAEEPALPEFNQLILDVINTYPTDGTHTYWWPRNGESNYDGCTTDISLAGQRVMAGEPQRRTFCCGLTLEVFVVAYKQWLAAHGGEDGSKVSPADFARFKRLWFVLEANGPGPSAALEAYGLGRTISQAEALPGDFVQLWRRSGSGHSVVFLGWAHNDAGEVIGFRYWSTQQSTQGIGEVTEYFAPEGERGVAAEHTHWARVEPAALAAQE